MTTPEDFSIAPVLEPPEAGVEAAATRPPLVRRLGSKFVRPAIEALAQRPRVHKYQLLSTCRGVSGSPLILQPVLFVGPLRLIWSFGLKPRRPHSPTWNLFFRGPD